MTAPKRPRVYAVTVLVEASGADADVRRELCERYEFDRGAIGAGGCRILYDIGRSRVLRINATRRRSMPVGYKEAL